jgi:hypothetical protein
MIVRKRASLFGVFFLLNACGGGDQTRIVHPTDANFSSSAIEWGLSSESDDDIGTIGNPGAFDTLGTYDEPIEEVFGSIAGIGIDTLGRAYVLDSQYQEIRVFSPEGRYILTVGGPGQGPGEFQDPEAIEVLGDQRVLVADRGGILKIFAPSDSQGLVETESINLGYPPESLCAMGGFVYLRGWSEDGGVIHKHRLDGSKVLSFGIPYRSPSRFVSRQLTKGTIACVPRTKTVIDLSLLFPFVRGFSEDGDLMWTAEIPGFLQMEIIEEVVNPGITFKQSKDHELGVSVTPVKNGAVLVQTAREHRTPGESGISNLEVRSFFLDSSDGSGHLLPFDFPVVLAHGDGKFYGVEILPFPRILVFGSG